MDRLVLFVSVSHGQGDIGWFLANARITSKSGVATVGEVDICYHQ
jgi:hypothetical protein